MKIAIDISQIVYGTGVSDYTKSLIASLLKIDDQNEYLLFGSSLRLNSVLRTSLDSFKGNFGRKIYSFPPIFLEQLWNRWHVLGIEKFTGKIDLFHSSDWLEPPSQCSKVTTIHDLSILKFPETFSPKGGHNIVTNMKRKFCWVKKESKLIIAVSQATKKDIVELLGIPEEKIKVIYEAAPVWFKKAPSEKVKSVKRKYGIKGDYLLSVATLEPRKNIKMIMKAHKHLLQKGEKLALVLAGKVGWGEDVSAEGKTVLTGYLANEELSALYTGASALVYPSLYEGFGLPVLEAMICGCPVVTSNVSSLPEVSGEAGILVDPRSWESIAGGIKKALEDRENLIKKGLIQAKKFSWEKCARETLEVYEKAIR